MLNTSRQLKQIEIELPALHPGQQVILDEARRFNALACGRRFGKTTLGLELAILKALEGFPVAWFSPTYKMLAEVWREARRTLKPVATSINAQEHRIELITGGVLEMWSLDNPDAPRGRKYARVVIDEAAQVARLDEAWQAVIRPLLTDYKGDMFMLSTPRGMNFFHECFSRGQDELQPDWASWHLPTVANPFIDPAEVDKAADELPEQIFRQEYLAEFLQSAGAVFRNIEACLTAPATRPEQHRGHKVVAGVDWAQKEDFTAISVICTTCKQEVEIDRFNKIEYAFQRARLQAITTRWQVKDVLCELNSIGQPNFEALNREGVRCRGFETTSASKPPLIQSLALALERKECRWLPDPVGKAELLAYESKVNPTTGRVSYSAPPGGHDDTVIARALAWHAHQHPQEMKVSEFLR